MVMSIIDPNKSQEQEQEQEHMAILIRNYINSENDSLSFQPLNLILISVSNGMSNVFVDVLSESCDEVMSI